MVERPILIGGVQHETNAFSPLATGLAEFRRCQYAEGDAIIERYRGTGTELGGIIAAADDHDLSLAPTMFAAATPSGMVDGASFATLKRRLCAPDLSGPRPAGAAIVLHGAMCAAGHDHADAVLLQAVRDRLGAGPPIVATLDFHANISAELVASADVLIGYETFPHTDMRDRGTDAMQLLGQLLAGRPRPVAAFRKLPLLPASETQVTERRPMREVMDATREAREDTDVVSCTIAAGYPFADIAHLGMSVLVYGSHDPANRAADRLARMIWERREAFAATHTALSDAIASAPNAQAPVILVDAADNVGGGAPGDGTAILAALLERGVRGAVVVLWDPVAAARATALRQGAVFRSDVGAHSGAGNGSPVALCGEIMFAASVRYTRRGSYMTGTSVDMGAVAVIEAQGNRVVLTSERVMPFDTDHLEAVGIVPAKQKIIVVKTASAWRAAFGDIGKTVIAVDVPGVCSQRFERLPYSYQQRKLYPIDPSTSWRAAT